jgi:hypothetical protein
VGEEREGGETEGERERERCRLPAEAMMSDAVRAAAGRGTKRSRAAGGEKRTCRFRPLVKPFHGVLGGLGWGIRIGLSERLRESKGLGEGA